MISVVVYLCSIVVNYFISNLLSEKIVLVVRVQGINYYVSDFVMSLKLIIIHLPSPIIENWLRELTSEDLITDPRGSIKDFLFHFGEDRTPVKGFIKQNRQLLLLIG